MIVDIILKVFMVVTAIFAFEILRIDFGNFFFEIKAVIARERRIVMNIEFTILDINSVIEVPMELNHGFLGLAGLKNSRQPRT